MLTFFLSCLFTSGLLTILCMWNKQVYFLEATDNFSYWSNMGIFEKVRMGKKKKKSWPGEVSLGSNSKHSKAYSRGGGGGGRGGVWGLSSTAQSTSYSLDSKQRNIWELKFVKMRASGEEPPRARRTIYTGINDYKDLRWEEYNQSNKKNIFVITLRWTTRNKI